MKVKDVAALLDTNPRKVRQLMLEGLLGYICVGMKKGYRISPLELQRFIALGGTRRRHRRPRGRPMTRERAHKIADEVRREAREDDRLARKGNR